MKFNGNKSSRLEYRKDVFFRQDRFPLPHGLLWTQELPGLHSHICKTVSSEQISEKGYILKKHLLLSRKAEFKNTLATFEDNRRNRFEPAIAFVNEAKTPRFLLEGENEEKKRDFLRKIGSNFQL